MSHPSKKIHQKSVHNFLRNLAVAIPLKTHYNAEKLRQNKGSTDRHQNMITWYLGRAPPIQKVSAKSVHDFFELSSEQTDRQTHPKTLTPSANVTRKHSFAKKTFFATFLQMF